MPIATPPRRREPDRHGRQPDSHGSEHRLQRVGTDEGICTTSSTPNRPLAHSTAVGARGERRHASQALKAAGIATIVSNHSPGNTQLESPSGARSDTGGSGCR